MLNTLNISSCINKEIYNPPWVVFRSLISIDKYDFLLHNPLFPCATKSLQPTINKTQSKFICFYKVLTYKFYN